MQILTIFGLLLFLTVVGIVGSKMNLGLLRNYAENSAMGVFIKSTFYIDGFLRILNIFDIAGKSNSLKRNYGFFKKF